MGFSRQEYWSGLLFHSPGNPPDPGIEPRSPRLQVDSFPSEPPGKPKNTGVGSLSLLQQIFPTQESSRGLLHCRWILYQLSHQGSPILPQLKINLKRQKNKNPTNKLPTKSQTSPGLGRPLEKGTATHSSILAWRIPRTV